MPIFCCFYFLKDIKWRILSEKYVPYSASALSVDTCKRWFTFHSEEFNLQALRSEWPNAADGDQLLSAVKSDRYLTNNGSRNCGAVLDTFFSSRKKLQSFGWKTMQGPANMVGQYASSDYYLFHSLQNNLDQRFNLMEAVLLIFTSLIFSFTSPKDFTRVTSRLYWNVSNML